MIFAAVLRVRCVAPLPPRSFGARRPTLGQGEVRKSSDLDKERLFGADLAGIGNRRGGASQEARASFPLFHGHGRLCHGKRIGKKEESQARTPVPREKDRKER